MLALVLPGRDWGHENRAESADHRPAQPTGPTLSLSFLPIHDATRKSRVVTRSARCLVTGYFARSFSAGRVRTLPTRPPEQEGVAEISRGHRITLALHGLSADVGLC